MRTATRIFIVAAAMALLAAPAGAKTIDGTHPAKFRVHPKRHWHGYGFLPGYQPQPALSDWRAQNRRRGYELRYFRVGPGGWYTGQVLYGYGRPGFYRGRWNGGSIGPCWTQTPIGPQWNCGR